VKQSTQQPIKETNSMNEAAVSNYREYVDIVRPPEVLRGNINEIQLLAQTARVWWMRTKNPLAAVLTDDYWTTMTDVRLQREDTIQLVSSFGADRAEHSILLVTESDKHGGAKVGLLHRYERPA
jgi:hypothetical protein